MTRNQPPATDHQPPTTDHQPPTTDHQPPTTSHRLRLFIGFAVGLFFLYLAFGKLDWSEVWRMIRSVGFPVLGAAVFLLAADYYLKIVRWWLMLRVDNPNLSISCCATPFLASLAANNCLPFRAGDVIRTVGFCRRISSPPMKVVGTMVIERLLDLLVLLAFFFGGLMALNPGTLPSFLIPLCQLLVLSAMLTLAVLFLFPRQLRSLVGQLTRHRRLSGSRAARLLQSALTEILDTLLLIHNGRLFLQIVFLTIVAWLLEGAMFAVIAWSLGIPSVFPGAWFALSTATLATLIPSTPGFAGTLDYFSMLGVQAFGAGVESAAAFALLVHAVLWLPVTLAGGIAMLLYRSGLSQVSQPADLENQEEEPAMPLSEPGRFGVR